MAGPLISFLTDFGPESAPGVCRGVMWGIAPEARILDLTHHVRRHAIRDGAFLLSRMVGYLPIGVHVAVVDPGVGTAASPDRHPYQPRRRAGRAGQRAIDARGARARWDRRGAYEIDEPPTSS